VDNFKPNLCQVGRQVGQTFLSVPFLRLRLAMKTDRQECLSYNDIAPRGLL
jgi:hypothetical protein